MLISPIDIGTWRPGVIEKEAQYEFEAIAHNSPGSYEFTCILLLIG